jgi:antitoxin component YwqK of YwqJK toxin-antitoxin module
MNTSLIKDLIKKYILFLFLSSVVCQAGAQNMLDRKGRRQGFWKTADTSRVLNYEGNFKDDMPFGDFTYYDRNGRVKAKAFYFRGGYASFNTFYDDSGRVFMTGYYLDKRKDSVWKFYHSGSGGGVLIKEEHYKQGLLDGTMQVFDHSGVLLETQEWYRGLRNGRWWSRQEKGFQTVTYKMNRSEGAYLALYPDSSLYITGQYYDGLKESEWKFYFDGGHKDSVGALYKIDLYEHSKLLSRRLFLIIENAPYNGTLQEINIDTVVMVVRKTGGRAEMFTASGGRLQCREKYESVCSILDIDYFFNASPGTFVAYRYVSGLSSEEIEDDRALLQLKIATPFPVYLDKEGIETVKSSFSSE